MTWRVGRPIISQIVNGFKQCRSVSTRKVNADRTYNKMQKRSQDKRTLDLADAREKPQCQVTWERERHFQKVPVQECFGRSSLISCQPDYAHGTGIQYSNQVSKLYGMHWMIPCSARSLASSSATQARQQTEQKRHNKDITTQEDPFDPLTDQIPVKPVTFVEGASYSVVIFAGLAIAGAAAYAVFKELIFEPKEYKIFGKALERVQQDSQVKVRIGSPITGYGQESRNRAARQRIPNRTWTDEDGVERVEVNFYIRGPHGAGKVYSEMFKDKTDKKWKFTYLIVDVTSPSKAQLMLESYVPT